VFLICLNHRLDPQYGCDGEEDAYGGLHKGEGIPPVQLGDAHRLSDPGGDGGSENEADEPPVRGSSGNWVLGNIPDGDFPTRQQPCLEPAHQNNPGGAWLTDRGQACTQNPAKRKIQRCKGLPSQRIFPMSPNPSLRLPPSTQRWSLGLEANGQPHGSPVKAVFSNSLAQKNATMANTYDPPLK